MYTHGAHLRDFSPTTDVQWYALRVKPRFEKVVARNLGDKGHEFFMPAYVSKRRWSDRVKSVELPLFPGYVFCRFSLEDKSVPVLSTPGVKEIVGVGRQPTPIDQSEIEAVCSATRSGLAYEPWPYLRVGQFVRVEAGALSGLEGVIINVKSTHRLILSVNLLMRSIAVEIDRNWVTPVDSHHISSSSRASANSDINVLSSWHASRL